MHEVCRAGREDVGDLAATLARAFADDPVARYIFPEAGRRARGLARFFAVQLDTVYLAHGEVWATPGAEAVALWMPPAPPPAQLAELRAQLRLVPHLGARFPAARRLARLLALHHPVAPHYYLGTLGTDPAHQRRGLGSALLGPVLERCDRDELPAYLESSRPENLGFYARHGFAVGRKVSAPGGGPPLWLMTRPPRRPAPAPEGAGTLSWSPTSGRG